MKAFAIFLTICVFILTFSILKSQSDLGTKKNLFWSLTTMVIFCGLVIGILTTLKQEELAGFAFLLMLSNVVFALVLIPILTFLMNDWIPTTTGTMLWIRLFVFGLMSIAITGALFGASLLFALANNPMDPASKIN
jgi:MFS family permease